MARQVIDTTTNNGTYIGDPAKTAFEKTNSNFGEIYGWAGSGPLAKLNGGNTFTGNQNISSGSLTVQSSITSNSGGISSLGNGSGFVMNDRLDYAQTWAMYANNTIFTIWNNTNGPSMQIARNGAVTALSFTPTSSADVKDFIEGYSGDACSQLDRLAVCTYKYKESYTSSDKTYIGIIAENFADVIPDGVSEDTHTETLEVVTGYDEHGNPLVESKQFLIPMGYDITQLLALNTRSHQQKNRKIKKLEESLAAVLARLDAAGI